MPNYLSPVGNDVSVDANGAPLSGGKVHIYLAGTTTNSTSYTTQSGSTPQANPIILNSHGLPDSPIWLPPGVSVKIRITDAAGVQQYPDYDNVLGINDPTGIASQDEWTTFQATATYVSATSFTVVGDKTAIFNAGRRIKALVSGGTCYGTVLTSAYGGVTTSVTISCDSIALDSGLSALYYGILSASNHSVPQITPQFQCQLSTNGANLVLLRTGGLNIFIDGANRTIPAGGVNLAPGALLAGTTYFIYAYMNAGTMTLEASTTSYTSEPTWGHLVKIADTSRTLVGMARTIVGPAWVNSVTRRFVLSYYNRRSLYLANGVATITGINNVSAERTTGNRCEFITWADDGIQSGFHGQVTDTAGAGTMFASFGIDGVSITQEQEADIRAANAAVPVSETLTTAVAEGYHYVSTHGRTLAGANGKMVVTNWALIRG